MQTIILLDLAQLRFHRTTKLSKNAVRYRKTQRAIAQLNQIGRQSQAEVQVQPR
ncbi:hypothetical protein [Planktothrix paucivesiculata]|uniref:hypothetical protein n=1 Tax=Planktothrix paucivesiculata TaxID=1678308 RepID=UPI0012DC4E88|nr:hypothetical protein [Planktothrix paucivesiculata]